MPAAAAGRVEGQRCGCKAGRVRLILNFSFPLLATHNLGMDSEEGLGPLVRLGFFSVSPPPSKVVGPLQGLLGREGLIYLGARRAVTGTGEQARIELID